MLDSSVKPPKWKDWQYILATLFFMTKRLRREVTFRRKWGSIPFFHPSLLWRKVLSKLQSSSVFRMLSSVLRMIRSKRPAGLLTSSQGARAEMNYRLDGHTQCGQTPSLWGRTGQRRTRDLFRTARKLVEQRRTYAAAVPFWSTVPRASIREACLLSSVTSVLKLCLCFGQISLQRSLSVT